MDSPFWEDNRKTEEDKRYLEALILHFYSKLDNLGAGDTLKKEYKKHFNITDVRYGNLNGK